jgi:hypothetical protein
MYGKKPGGQRKKASRSQNINNTETRSIQNLPKSTTPQSIVQVQALASTSAATPNDVPHDYEIIDDIQSQLPDSASNKPPFDHGSFYKEIKKPYLERLLWDSRHVRRLTCEVMATYNNDKSGNKKLGTDDPEENSALFSEAVVSHINHQEFSEAAECLAFAQENNIQLSPEATAKAEKFFLERKKTLEEEHKSLAPQLAKD